MEGADKLLEAAVDPRPDPHQRLAALSARRRERIGKAIGWTMALLVGGAVLLFNLTA